MLLEQVQVEKVQQTVFYGILERQYHMYQIKNMADFVLAEK